MLKIDIIVMGITMNLSLPNYQIIEILGQGSVSDVYLAKNDKAELVAIKVLKNFLKNDEEVLNRVLKESEILSILKDERIVKMLSTSITSDGRPAIIQEYVNGKNLNVLLSEQTTPYSPIIGCIIISEILLGLEEAHRNGIIHRDLKPENIMLTTDGRIKITDFGIAKNIYCEEATRPGLIIGSPAYMSPEQITNQNIDDRSDLYSLGVILYKYATGQLPFFAQNYASTVNKVINEESPNPIKFNPHLHPSLITIIKKALQKDPKKRYQKAYEFRFDLLKLLEELAIHNFKQELNEYFQQKNYLKNFSDERLLSTLIQRAENAVSSGDTINAQKFLHQAINIKPDNEKPKLMLKKINKKSNKSISILISLLVVGVISFISYKPKTDGLKISSNKTVEIKDEVKMPMASAQAVTPVPIESNKPKTSKIINEIKKVEIKKLTAVKFITDPDTKIFLDDKLITKRNKPIKVVSGKHKIQLYKDGFSPIASEIFCPQDEVTTVNTTGGN